jgi:hypothetical protein
VGVVCRVRRQHAHAPLQAARPNGYSPAPHSTQHTHIGGRGEGVTQTMLYVYIRFGYQPRWCVRVVPKPLNGQRWPATNEYGRCV